MMRRRRAEILSFALIGVVAIGIGFGVARTMAARPRTEQAAAAQVRLDPVRSQVQLGETFTVNLQVDAPENLAAYQVDLVYDPAVVEVITVTLGPLLGSTGRAAEPLGPKLRMPGRTTFAGYSYGDEPGASQSGNLAQIRLRAAGPGRTPLQLESLQLLNPQAGALTGQAAGAEVEVAAAHNVFLPFIHGGP